MRRALALLAISGSPLAAQEGAFLTAGRVLAGTPDEASWRITVQRDLIGPLGLDVSALMLPGSRPSEGELYGVGGDVTIFAASRAVPTVFIGAAAGLGFNDQKRVWTSGSVGVRFTLVNVGVARVMAEGRWRNLTVPGRDGVELGVTLGYRRNKALTTGRPETAGLWMPRATADALRRGGIPESKARVLGGVVTTALEEMGQPYVWGGTGDGSGGFDCSGLIYYAYQRQGIAIPRTSASQARAGVAIRRDADALLPGDILTFAERGDQVTHVGLYVGEGRFIHSSSKGVRLSRLAEDDTEGRWWLRRWVGVRRIVE
jgi:cell wall-associated NlpC family hydrolase